MQTLNLFQKQSLLKHKRYQVGGNEYFTKAFKYEICRRKLPALSSFLTSELFKSVFKDSLSLSLSLILFLRSESRDFSLAERRIKSVDLLCVHHQLYQLSFANVSTSPLFRELRCGILFYCSRRGVL